MVQRRYLLKFKTILSYNNTELYHYIIIQIMLINDDNLQSGDTLGSEYALINNLL